MVGVFGIVWLSFFLLRKDLRHQQLFVSIFTAPLAPVTQILWFYKDYWRPEYVWTFTVLNVPLGVEEVLFAFFIGGIGSILYEVIFRTDYKPGRWRFKETAYVVIFSGVFFGFLKTLDLNTVWASSIALVLSSLMIVYLDKNVRIDWVMSSVLMFALVMFTYLACFALFPAIVSKFWLPSGLSGINLLGVPVEEIIWFVSWAMYSGVAYEFMVGAGPYKKLLRTVKVHAKI